MVSPLANPLSALSDIELFDTQVTLALACSRSKSAERGKHRQRICFLQGLLATESKNRGKAPASAPYKA